LRTPTYSTNGVTVNMNTQAASNQSDRSIEVVLRSVAERYPSDLVGDQIRDVPRIAFNIGLVTSRLGVNVAICDLGGGIGLFSAGCAAIGMRSILVDDFSDSVNFRHASVPDTVHRPLGVDVVNCDVVAAPPPQFAANSIDVITSFDSMEHWHNSPKALFHQAMSWLSPGGLLVLGVPNCVNLRKRLTVPLGRGKWSSMDDWYEQTRFRGHVREPDIGDLRYIANDLGLKDVEIVGRNWLGYYHRSSAVRLATRVMDVPLRAFPSLCADLYLIGRKSS
jgi:2-polyprenyl-3-methyl-5-hydroxy-6-metoxy-1,4-benzoquinol methylase